MPKAFPIEFRRDVVAVARNSEAPLSQIAKDLWISESCLHRRLRPADVDDRVRPGTASSHSARAGARSGAWVPRPAWNGHEDSSPYMNGSSGHAAVQVPE